MRKCKTSIFINTIHTRQHQHITHYILTTIFFDIHDSFVLFFLNENQIDSHQLILVIVCLALAGCEKRRAVLIEYQEPQKDYTRQLPPGELALRKITNPSQIPDFTLAFYNTEGLMEAIEHSLNYMAKSSSKSFYPYGDITHEHAVRSLQELKKLVTSGLSPQQMNAVLREKFDTYISVGCDDQGTVLFTGYYTPIFDGSPIRTDRFKYPLYKTPNDLLKGPDGTILGQKGRTARSGNILAGRIYKNPISFPATSLYGLATHLRFI